ncbi:uncharacterized protein TNCV_5018941 [Trichonephila clavipes]|nr:uncharacterized protein TNCV_5018941 [Trichonephila clavipes]
MKILFGPLADFLEDEVSLRDLSRMWHQHDEAPAHKSAQPCIFLAQTFDTRIIGYGGQEVAEATGGVSDAEHVISKARRRLPILKLLAVAKWGCGRATLNITYKSYVQPVLNYCDEVLISASNKVLGMRDVFQNQVLRLITDGVKITHVLPMHLH